MPKSQKVYIVFAAIAIALIIWGIFFYSSQSTKVVPVRVPENTVLTDLGFVYLPLTPNISEYYSLCVDSGALITEVIAGSLGDKSGLEVGDVVVSLNSKRVDNETPLLGIIKTCPYGTQIRLGIVRDNSMREIDIVYPIR